MERPPRSSVRGRGRWALLSLAPLSLLLACDGGPVRTIEQVRTVEPSQALRKRIGASSAERFGFPIVWDTPAGWTPETTAGGMRLASFALPGGAECSLSLLPGEAGGAAANVNRWRRQMGQPPLDPAGLAALPRRPLLGREAVYVELEGDYAGMGGDALAGAKLIGLIAEGEGGASVFVKMTGPAPAVDSQAEAFEAFCRSLEATDA